MDDSKLLLRCSEAAERLGLGRAKVYLMAASGELPSVRIGNRAVRIPAQALEDWVREQVSSQGASASEKS